VLFSNDGGGDGGDGPSVLMHCWLELVLWLRELVQLSLRRLLLLWWFDFSTHWYGREKTSREKMW
jgi:hypothetical protein